MMDKLLFFLLWVTGFIWGAAIQAQETLQVFEKQFVIEQSTDHVKKLFIHVEKATVSISTWSKPLIKAEVRYVSKHARKEIAERELGYLDLNKGIQGSTFIMRTILKLPRGQEAPQSALNFHIHLQVPEGLALECISKLGKISIDGGSMPVAMHLHLSQLEIHHAQIHGSIQQEFGSLLIKESVFKGKIELKRSIAQFDHVGGELLLSGESGKWTIQSFSNFKSLEINTSRTELVLQTAPTLVANMMLQGARLTMHSDLLIPKSKIGEKQYRIGPPQAVASFQITNKNGLIFINPH